jgi:hypothetical protein
MSETRENFKDAADWEKKYRPIRRGTGTRVRSNGTLFDRQGEHRRFVITMEREFVWSVFHNGFFEYIQAGLHKDSDVVGYLVTDNPVLFADLTSKFAIGYHMIDWTALAHRGEPGCEEPMDLGDVSAVTRIIDAPSEMPAASVQKVEVELVCEEIASRSKDERPSTHEPVPGKRKDRTPNSVKRLVGSFRRKTEEKRPMSSRETVEEPRSVLAAAPETPVSPSPTLAPVSELLPPEMPLVITPTPAQMPAPGRPTSVLRPKSRFARPRPKPAPLPFPQFAPPSTPAPDPQPTPKPTPVQVIVASSVSLKPKTIIPPATPPAHTPAADPLPLPDTSAATAMALQVRVRYLPFGIDAAKLDQQVYGPWPNAIECKVCGGSGYFGGVVVGLIACDDCEGRGWNPPPGTPAELVVPVK